MRKILYIAAREFSSTVMTRGDVEDLSHRTAP
jgi:hypothetical protein